MENKLQVDVNEASCLIAVTGPMQVSRLCNARDIRKKW